MKWAKQWNEITEKKVNKREKVQECKEEVCKGAKNQLCFMKVSQGLMQHYLKEKWGWISVKILA